MISLRSFSRLLAAVSYLGLLNGCSVLSPKPDLSRSYVLNPVTEKVSPAPPPDPTLSLGVAYAIVPDYLNRVQMVVRLSNNQPYNDEYHRWLEPLGAGISRVLAQDIALLADSSHVLSPMPPGFAHDFEVQVSVAQFDGAPANDVTLRVKWTITGSGGRPTYFYRESVFTRRDAGGADPAVAYVDTLSHLVNDLAREIVRQMPQARAAQAATRR